MTLPEPLRLSAVEQAELVRSGELSARELVASALRACDELDPEINAFVARCDERALAEADRVRAGDPRPLCGVPIGLKDLLSAVAGLPTTNGSWAFPDWRPDHDAAHVRRLREAGAIVIGRTNAPELGLRPVTENLRFGITRNPWDPSLSPGGSSGGSAAAVAAGIVALADGSDLGGSIRIPAACCGLVGLKPSRARVSIGPDFGDVTQGAAADCVLTRTVRDTAVALDAIAGPEPGDHLHLPLPDATFAAALRTPPPRLRVDVALTAPLGAPVDAEPRVAARLAGRALADLGHDVAERTPEQQVELLVGAAELDVGARRRPSRSPAAADRAAPASRSAGWRRSAWRSRRARASAPTVVVRSEREQLRHRHVEPFAVEADARGGRGSSTLSACSVKVRALASISAPRRAPGGSTSARSDRRRGPCSRR